MSGRVAIGRYSLVLGDPAGTAIAPAAGQDEPRALAQAIARAPDEREPLETAARSFEGAVEDASQTTRKAEHAARLFTEITQGRLDPAAIGDEVNALLGLLGRLDRDERWEEALNFARSLATLLALLGRWADLLQSLRVALSAADRLHDTGGRAWALHELGTLHLAAEKHADADRLLGEAHNLRERIGDKRGLAMTDHNLQILCRTLRSQLHTPPRRSVLQQLLGKPMIAFALAILLLALGGVAGAMIRGSGSSESTTNAGATTGEATQSGPAPSGGGSETTTATTPNTDSTGTQTSTSTLSVQKSGTGKGTIASDDELIDCGAVCDADYTDDAAVTLTATAAEGSRFTGWSDACSGVDDCQLKMGEDESVTATFVSGRRSRPVEETSTNKEAETGTGEETGTGGE